MNLGSVAQLEERLSETQQAKVRSLPGPLVLPWRNWKTQQVQTLWPSGLWVRLPRGVLALLAQLEEQRVSTPQVAGSNPAQGSLGD